MEERRNNEEPRPDEETEAERGVAKEKRADRRREVVDDRDEAALEREERTEEGVG
jgi:hypothetical protein